MTDQAEFGRLTEVVTQLRGEAATVQVGLNTLPKTGFLISVPQYSLAGRGDWSDAEVFEWWQRVKDVCTEARPWFARLAPIRGLGTALNLAAEQSVLYAGTWTDRETKWFDANLHIRRDLIVTGKASLGDLHPPTKTSPPASGTSDVAAYANLTPWTWRSPSAAACTKPRSGNSTISSRTGAAAGRCGTD